VIDAATAEFLATGCGLLVGTVSEDGEPCATRGWGASVEPPDGLLRVLLDADDHHSLTEVVPGRAIAVTAADVRTLRSLQMKGRVRATGPATESDRARAQVYCDDFYRDIADTDGTDRRLLERMTPRDYVACLVDLDELFDQTPGPTAGRSIST
jgi:hypothetical protein